MPKPVRATRLRVEAAEFLVGFANPSIAPGVSAALGSYYVRLPADNVFQKFGAADVDWMSALVIRGGLGSTGWGGDGSDGDVVLPPGTTTLTRAMTYNTLVVPNGAVLDPAQYPIYARESIVIEPGGVIRSNGNDGVGTAGGATRTGNVLGPGNNGANGSAGGGAGNTRASTTGRPSYLPSNTGQGGAGGASGAGQSGGNGGAINPMTNLAAPNATFYFAMFGAGGGGRINGGNGGGGGGAAPGSTGGGGGGGAGPIMLSAPRVENHGTIEARGGNGAAGTGAAGGGGGGGGGAMTWVIARDFIGTAPDVSGGAGGAGSGIGANGADGNAGFFWVWPE